MDFFPFSLFLAMQQKGLCLSAVAFEVLGHHRQPALAADLPHGRHHGHHFNHGRVQHGESRLPPGGGFFFLMPVLVEFWNLSCSFFGSTILCPLNSTPTAAGLPLWEEGYFRWKPPSRGGSSQRFPTVMFLVALGCRKHTEPWGQRAQSWWCQRPEGLSAGRPPRGSRGTKSRTVQWHRCPALEHESPDSKHQLLPDQLCDFWRVFIKLPQVAFSFLKNQNWCFSARVVFRVHELMFLRHWRWHQAFCKYFTNGLFYCTGIIMTGIFLKIGR